MKLFFEQRRPHEGLTYEAYVAAWAQRMEQPLAGLDRHQRRYLHYARYNLERAQRVQAAYEVSAALQRALLGVRQPQLWMVLTEDWCGDSAYSLPVIAGAAALSEQVTLRILLRDANLDIMDHYLTSGGRSIPRLVAFGPGGEERFRWGPRPAEAQVLRDAWKAEGKTGSELSNALLAWYEGGGWRRVDAELTDLVLHAEVPSAA